MDITPEELRPFVRAVAPVRVGKRRSDPDDIARILFAFGCGSTAGEIAVQRAAELAVPPVPEPDPLLLARAATLHRDVAHLASPPSSELDGGSAYRQAVGELASVIDRIHRPANERAAAVAALVDGWWHGNHQALWAICRQEAAALLAARAGDRLAGING